MVEEDLTGGGATVLELAAAADEDDCTGGGAALELAITADEDLLPDADAEADAEADGDLIDLLTDAEAEADAVADADGELESLVDEDCAGLDTLEGDDDDEGIA